MAVLTELKILLVPVALVLGLELGRAPTTLPYENCDENWNGCMDTIIMKTDFPNFPFGERRITREWLSTYFRLSKRDIKFKLRDLGDGYKDSVFLLSLGRSHALFGTGLNTHHSRYLGLEEAEILDSRIELVNGVRVGNTKWEFFRALSITDAAIDCDQFLIVDEEWQGTHEFYFRADTLYRIKLQFMD
jgi:hypothetical protein